MTLDGMPSTAAVHLDLSGTDLPEWVAGLFRQEAGSVEAILGAPLVVGPAVDGEPCWIVEPRADDQPVTVTWDPEHLRLVSTANGAREVLDSTLLLGRLARSSQRRVEWSVPETVDDAVDVFVDALENDAAYWQFAAEPWPVVRDRALASRPGSWDEFRAWAEELLAHLPDGHARIAATSQTTFNPPYQARLDGDHVILSKVPEGSAAFAAGVRPGWTSAVPDAERWWRTTPASPQGRPWRTARRFLRVVGDERTFTATSPDGHAVTWVEARSEQPRREVITVSHNPSGAVLVWLDSFSDDPRITEVMDELCKGANPDDHMVLDLRGNPGGKVVVEHALAGRFLRQKTFLGTTTYSDARGGFGPHVERWGDPSDDPCWPGRLTILVDVHTFSSPEAFVGRLQGLPHVTVLGDATGGGIGMPCRVPLGHGLEAWFASAICYDRGGPPIDVRGIRPDGPLVDDPTAL
ncbi:S41 family peptidase [Luteococcus sp. OSA5]|uniref:S41 family peptidase n=1 Tax=Luteococcus sp. OSA5 TaxID=3401630 RepID=UPI003B42D4FF